MVSSRFSGRALGPALSRNRKTSDRKGEKREYAGFRHAPKLDFRNVGSSWKSTSTTRSGPGYEHLAYTGSRELEGTKRCAWVKRRLEAAASFNIRRNAADDETSATPDDVTGTVQGSQLNLSVKNRAHLSADEVCAIRELDLQRTPLLRVRI